MRGGVGAVSWVACMSSAAPSVVAPSGLDSLSVACSYPTYGYETESKGKPLTLEVNTATPDGRTAGINLFYTAADQGYGGYQIT